MDFSLPNLIYSTCPPGKEPEENVGKGQAPLKTKQNKTKQTQISSLLVEAGSHSSRLPIGASDDIS